MTPITAGAIIANGIGSDSVSTGDEFAKQTDYLRYKNVCDNPPPPTGDKCKDLKNMIEYHRKCGDLRQEWDDKYFPGRHAPDIAKERRLERKYQNRLDNAWDCREQCND